MRRPCADPPKDRWNLPGTGRETALFSAALADVTTADAAWARQRRSTDTHGWTWERVLRETQDCIYRLGSATHPVAGLFAAPAKLVKLPAGKMLRLNYFQIAPELRGTGAARLFLAIIARFARGVGAVGLLVPSLPSAKVVNWYVGAGGIAGPIDGWNLRRSLHPIAFGPATIKHLAEFADAVQEEANT